MTAKQLIENFDPDQHAGSDWANHVLDLQACREELQRLGYNRSALGQTPGGLCNFMHWHVDPATGIKVQFDEPNHLEQWIIALVCPPPRYGPGRQNAAAKYVPQTEVNWLAKELKRAAKDAKLDPKTTLEELTAKI